MNSLNLLVLSFMIAMVFINHNLLMISAQEDGDEDGGVAVKKNNRKANRMAQRLKKSSIGISNRAIGNDAPETSPSSESSSSSGAMPNVKGGATLGRAFNKKKNFMKKRGVGGNMNNGDGEERRRRRH